MLNSQTKENQLINIITKLSGSSFIGDDCAVIKVGDQELLLSVDNFVEDTHFKSNYFSPYDIGWKSLAVNISDIAAMAGLPLYYLVAINLSKSINNQESWLTEFYRGLLDCAQAFGQPQLIGGDLCASQHETSISVTIIGKAPNPGQVLWRHETKPGYKVCVTGKFGNSASFLEGSRRDSDIQAHLRPSPRLQESQSLAEGALMDASDGLAQSLWTLARASDVELLIDTNLIPRDEHISLELALYGGEDYELVGCFSNVPPGFQPIGEVKAGSASVIDSQKSIIIEESKVFKHFL